MYSHLSLFFFLGTLYFYFLILSTNIWTIPSKATNKSPDMQNKIYTQSITTWTGKPIWSLWTITPTLGEYPMSRSGTAHLMPLLWVSHSPLLGMHHTPLGLHVPSPGVTMPISLGSPVYPSFGYVHAPPLGASVPMPGPSPSPFLWEMCFQNGSLPILQLWSRRKC